MSRYRKTDVAGQALRPQTQMMSFGYDPALSEGSIKPPLFQTSTFAFKSAEDGKRQFALRKGLAQRAPGEEFGLVYWTRSWPPTRCWSRSVAARERKAGVWRTWASPWRVRS